MTRSQRETVAWAVGQLDLITAAFRDDGREACAMATQDMAETLQGMLDSDEDTIF